MLRKPNAEAQREDIEHVVWKLYENKLYENRHKPGNLLDKNKLWEEAEKIVHSPFRTTLFASNRLLIKFNQEVGEPLLAWANRQAILSLLGLIGNLSLIVAVATYIGFEKQRRDAEVLNAWQTITSAYGQSGSGGRIQALEFLNASPGANWRRKFPWFCAPLALCLWEKESLVGINLSSSDEDRAGVYLARVNLEKASLENANLQGANLERGNLNGSKLNGASLENANLNRVQLENANLNGAKLENANPEGASLIFADLERASLVGANLEGASLEKADLEGTKMWFADLEGAFLVGANLKRASLEEANLERASLEKANLEGASLERANLEGASLVDAKLEGASLVGAKLEGASLVGAKLERAKLLGADLEGTKMWFASLKGASLEKADLEGTDLWLADLEGANLEGANLKEALNLTQNQLALATLCRTTLPEGITLDPNRDCKKLRIVPETDEDIWP